VGFGLILFFSALTGFAQMPIFKRYYIADLPGLGWLAQFYTTYWLHYLAAILFMALAAYLITDFLLRQRRSWRVTPFGYLRGAMLLIILATGVMLVYRNLPGYRFPALMVVVLDFTHLGMVVLFLMSAFTAKVLKQPWVVARSKI
jgi:hypothetical protein